MNHKCFLLLPLLCGLVSAAGAADPELEAAIEKRLLRLKRTEAARQEILAERDKLQMQFQTAAGELQQAQLQVVAANRQVTQQAASLAQLQTEHAALVAQGTALAQARTPDVGQLRLIERQIQATRTLINQANVAASQANMAAQQFGQRAAVLEAQAVGINRSLQGTQQKLELQSLDYRDQADLFGTLSRAEQAAALATFNEWVKADGQNYGARLLRALAHRKLEKFDDSLADLSAIIEAKSSLGPLALALRGELQVARGHEREGLGDLGLAHRQEKKDGRIYLLRGLAYLRTGKFAAAEADFKSAARLDKEDVQAFRLAGLLYASGEIPGARDAKRALDCATKACELAKFADWACLDALAAAHAESGDYDEAARTAREAAELTFDDNRELCRERVRQYEARLPLRLKFK